MKVGTYLAVFIYYPPYESCVPSAGDSSCIVAGLADTRCAHTYSATDTTVEVTQIPLFHARTHIQTAEMLYSTVSYLDDNGYSLFSQISTKLLLQIIKSLRYLKQYQTQFLISNTEQSNHSILEPSEVLNFKLLITSHGDQAKLMCFLTLSNCVSQKSYHQSWRQSFYFIF